MAESVPERLDIRSVIQRNNATNTKIGVIALFIVPLVAFVIGLGIQGLEHRRFPTLIQVVMGISIVVGALYLLSVFNNKRHPEKHSAFDWPEVGSPNEVLQAIETSWNTSSRDDKVAVTSDHFLTPDWLLHIDSTSFDAWPLKELVWAFYSVKSNYVNGIPTGTTRNINLRFITPSHFTFIPVTSDEAAAEFLFALQKRAPWSFFGHTEANHRGWHKERASMIEAVRERISQVSTGQEIPQPDTLLQAEETGK